MEGSPAPPDLLARAREQKPDYADRQKLLVKEDRLTPIHLVERGIQNLNWACLVHSGSQEEPILLQKPLSPDIWSWYWVLTLHCIPNIPDLLNFQNSRPSLLKMPIHRWLLELLRGKLMANVTKSWFLGIKLTDQYTTMASKPGWRLLPSITDGTVKCWF